MSSDYRVNKATGQVVKDDGTGWKPVASVRNKTTGEILIDEGNGWQPMPGSQRNLQADPAMTMASQRANTAMASGQKIAQDDLTQLGRPDFSTAAMARLPAPTKSVADLDAFDAQRAAEKEALRVPDSDFKERSIIAMNVPTFGSGPRLAAGAQTVGALLATPFVEGDIIDREGISGAADQFLDEARIHQRRGRTERPLESIATEVIPSLFQGKTIIDTLGKRVLPATNTVSNVGRVAGVGGLYGAIYAGSQNESGTAEGVAGDAAFGGALGVGGGLLLKGAEPAATATYRTAKTAGAGLYDGLAAALGKAGGARDKVAQEVALAAVRRSMERSGMTFDQIMEQVKRYEGKPAVLAEVIGQDAVNALTALTRRPGSTPQRAQDIIEDRFYGRPDRLKGDVEDATGINIGQLDETLETQLIERQEAAKPIYDALYKQYSTIKSFGESLKRINRLARTPAMQKHLKLAEEAVKTQAGIRQVPVSKMSKMEYWDLVKRSLDDEINSAVAKGEARTKVGASVAELTQLKKGLTDEFDRLTDGAYAAAREAGGEAPRLKAAAVAGQKALQARNPRDVAKIVAGTLPQDLPALRAGMVDDLGTRIDKGMTPGRVRVPDVAGKLREGLGEEAANKLINRFDAEAALSETGSRWAPRMNSVTGTVMESGATQMGDDLINAGFNLASGNKLGLLRQAINFMRQRGFSQRQIDAIGDLLLSSPEEGLRRLRVMAPDGVPSNAAAPIAGAGGPDGLPPGGGGLTPQAAQAASKPGSNLGTKAADATAIGVIATGGPTAQADTGDPQQRLDELSQRETAAQQLITEYEQGLKDFQNLSVTEKQIFLRDNGFTGEGGAILKDDGRTGGNTTYAINAYTAKMQEAISAAQAEREMFRKQINEVRVGMAERQENPPNPLFDKAAELGTYAAMIYGAHRLRGAATKGSQVAARRVAADANALLTRLPVPPQPPNKTLLSRVPVVGSKEKTRIARATNAANKAARATEERLAGRDVPPISSNPTSENGLPTRTANLQEFDRRQAAGDFGPVGPIGRLMEPINSRVRAGDVGIIGAGAADTYIMQGMLDKTRADIAAEETRLAEARKAADPDRIQASNDRLEQLRKAETVQTILQRVGVGLMIGGTVGLAHGRYSRPQPRFEAANRERELIRLAQTPPPLPVTPPLVPVGPQSALLLAGPPSNKPRTAGAPRKKPPVSFSGGNRPRKPSNDND